jgi:hypothetical protein
MTVGIPRLMLPESQGDSKVLEVRDGLCVRQGKAYRGEDGEAPRTTEHPITHPCRRASGDVGVTRPHFGCPVFSEINALWWIGASTL